MTPLGQLVWGRGSGAAALTSSVNGAEPVSIMVLHGTYPGHWRIPCGPSDMEVPRYISRDTFGSKVGRGRFDFTLGFSADAAPHPLSATCRLRRTLEEQISS